MSMLDIVVKKKYKDGMTKQAFADQCDINKILKKAARHGSLAHLVKYPEATYGEFDGEFSLLDATQKIARAGEIFADLPSEVRREFDNDPIAFVTFAGDPANNDKLKDLLPALAKPGDYFPNPVQRGGSGAGMATAPNAAANPPAAAVEPETAEAAPEAPVGTDG